MFYEHSGRTDSKLDRHSTSSLAAVQLRRHRCRTRGEASLRPDGGEDARHLHISNVLDARDDCCVGGCQTRALRGTFIRGDCSARIAGRWRCAPARTFGQRYSRSGWSHEAIYSSAHSPQCGECARPLSGGVRSRVRRRRCPQKSANRDVTDERFVTRPFRGTMVRVQHARSECRHRPVPTSRGRSETRFRFWPLL